MFTMSLAGFNRPLGLFNRASLAVADVVLISSVVVWYPRVRCPGCLGHSEVVGTGS